MKKPFMKKTVLTFLFLAGMLSLAYAGKGFYCRDHKEMIKEILSVRKQAFLATAITGQGLVLQVFVSVRDGGFSVIGIGNDGGSCLLLSGNEWMYAMERKILPVVFCQGAFATIIQ